MSTLGQTIGVVEHTFSVKNDHDEKVTLRVKIDFSNVSDNDIRDWVVSNRIIALQRPMRSLSADEIKAINSRTFAAGDCGKKIESIEKQRAVMKSTLLATFIASGVEKEQAEQLAEMAINNPAALAAVASK